MLLQKPSPDAGHAEVSVLDFHDLCPKQNSYMHLGCKRHALWVLTSGHTCISQTEYNSAGLVGAVAASLP